MTADGGTRHRDDLSAEAGPSPGSGAGATRGAGWRAAGMLCWREIVRFLRQRNRIVGAIGQPLLFWLLFGTGLKQSFRLSPAGMESGQTFQQYYFPGTLLLILLFTAIFATISVIEDRREGFLQSVLVAPVPRWSLVLGKVLGGSLLALGQGLLFLILMLAISAPPSLASLLAIVGLLFVSALGLTSLGLVLAWRMQSTQGFHAIMSLVLMPLWLLSGAFFPAPRLDAQAGVLDWTIGMVMQVNPLTYAVAGLRQLMFPELPAATLGLPALPVCWLVTAVFAAVAFVAAWWIAGRRTTGDAQ
ncbi:MAG: ABC transporter permease [Pirellulaceae bacterium]|nr:ABC transporter permease [Pirellulaceae bacterium]